MTLPTNAERCGRAAEVLEFYRGRWDVDEADEVVLVDLLADLLHAAPFDTGDEDETKRTLVQCLDVAEGHHYAEITDGGL